MALWLRQMTKHKIAIKIIIKEKQKPTKMLLKISNWGIKKKGNTSFIHADMWESSDIVIKIIVNEFNSHTQHFNLCEFENELHKNAPIYILSHFICQCSHNKNATNKNNILLSISSETEFFPLSFETSEQQRKSQTPINYKTIIRNNGWHFPLSSLAFI